jgi:hypothetical protein
MVMDGMVSELRRKANHRDTEGTEKRVERRDPAKSNEARTRPDYAGLVKVGGNHE